MIKTWVGRTIGMMLVVAVAVAAAAADREVGGMRVVNGADGDPVDGIDHDEGEADAAMVVVVDAESDD